MNSLDNFKKILTSNSREDIEDFISILELPDEVFDTIYGQIKDKINTIYTSSEFRNKIIQSYKTTPEIAVNVEEDLAEVHKLMSDIKEEPGLSENKKELIISVIENSLLKVLEIYKNPRSRVNIKVKKLHPDAIIPTYAHDLDAGADVCAIEDVVLKPNQTGVIVKTGLAMEIPAGWEIQVRPRSGMTHKTKLRIGNAPGTIDSCYRGEIGVIVDNIGNLSVKIEKGQKIAQLVLAETPMMEFTVVEDISETDRNENGFGSTGEKAES